MPLAVKIAGMTHGVFFILFIASLWDVKITSRWPLAKISIAFVSSLLPFGTFVLDARMLKKESNKHQIN